MPYISGIDRNQMLLFSFNDFVPQDSPVRLIDAFVSHLDLNKLDYITFVPSSRGQQPYDRADLIKLHIYGYMNGIRSSRKLATEASRNLELIWLVNNTCPSKSCISDFVKNNKRPLKNTFKQFIDFLNFAEFIDSKAVCIDGTKIRAQNSRNKYYSTKKIDATISYFNGQMDKYLHNLKSELSSVDVDPNSVLKLKKKINDYEAKLQEYLSTKKNMDDNGLSQVTLTDPDSRMMTSHGNSDISYNLQTSVDSKNSLIVACDVVSDVNDTNQLENMVNKSCENLGTTPESSIADMGYFNAEQISNCEKLGTKVYVKRPKTKNSTNNSTFSVDKFTFNKDTNTYTCPAGKELTFSRNLRKKKNKNDSETSIVGYEYSCSHCSNCPYLDKCTSSSSGRSITRNFYQDTLDVVQQRFEENPEMYTLRKSTVEHPFGTIKRSLGYTYFLRKGLASVNAEAALICLAYNFKRLINLSDFKDIIQKMEMYFSTFHSNFYYFISYNKKIINFFRIYDFFVYFNFYLAIRWTVSLYSYNVFSI